MKRITTANLLAVLLILAIPVQSLRAQGTQAMVPDPISALDLATLIVELGADNDQRHAIEAAHERYIDDVLAWRDGPVQDFLEEQLQQQRQGQSLSLRAQRDAYVHFLRGTDRLHAELAHKEATLFKRCSDALREEQLLILKRAELWRARAGLHGSMLAVLRHRFPAAGVDLVALLESFVWPEAERDAIEHVLREYEVALTAVQAEAFAVYHRSSLDLLEPVVEQGFHTMDLADETLMADIQMAIEDSARRVGERVIAAVMRIVELNRRTMDSFEHVLSSESARNLRETYFRSAYPTTPARWRFRDLQRAAQLASIAGHVRDELNALAIEFEPAERRLFLAMAELSETEWRRNTSFMLGTGGPKLAEERKRLERQHQQLGKRVDDALLALIGPEWREQIRGVAEHGVPRRPETGRSALERAMDAPPPPRSDPSPWIALARGTESAVTPFALSVLDTVLDALEVSPEHRVAVLALHADSMRRFHDACSARIKVLRGRHALMWRSSDDGVLPTPSVTSINAMHAETARLTDSMHAFDASLFAQVRASLPELAEERVRLLELVERMRSREVLRFDLLGWRGSLRPQTSEGALDFVALVFHVGWCTDSIPDLALVPAGYESAMERLLADIARRGVECDRLYDERRAIRFQHASRNETMPAELSQSYEPRLHAERTEIGRSIEAMIQLNQAALQRACELLPADDALKLRQAYEELAFPRMVEAMPSFDAAWEQVLKIDSLSAEQLQGIEILRADAARQSGALRDSMIDILRKSALEVDPFGLDANWVPERLSQCQMGRLQFGAMDQFARTYRRVRDLLTDEQRAEIGWNDRSNRKAEGF